MPKGPRGEKRPADVIGAAVMVGKIATGEIHETISGDSRKKSRKEAAAIGGKNRAARLSPKKRKEIASKASRKRWSKSSA